MRKDIAEVPLRYNTTPNIAEKIFGYTISVILHPIFIPMYVVIFLLYIHPDAFTGFSDYDKMTTLRIVGVNVVFFPLLTVLLLKAVKFIDSVQMHTRKDRIIPLIACGIFFFWAFTVFKEQHRYPAELVRFFLGIFLASSVGLLANIYFKISLHGLAMGGWLGFFVMLLIKGSLFMAWPLALVIMLTGLVATARLLVASHQPKDIYLGILFGIISQIAAAIFY